MYLCYKAHEFLDGTPGNLKGSEYGKAYLDRSLDVFA